MQRLILASGSQRRKSILEQLGLQFEIIESNIEEVIEENCVPEEVAKSLAYQKAYDVAQKVDDSMIIGADTIVVLDNEILGKPKDEADIYNMLRKLSKRVHKVITGVCLYNAKDNSYLLESDTSLIKMREITDDEIKGYVASGEPFGKAGSYAIQGFGGIFVEKIEGNYSGIVGLSVFTIDKMLKHYGVEILSSKR